MWRCVLAPDADRGSEELGPDELPARLERLRSSAATSTSATGASAGPSPAQGGPLLSIVWAALPTAASMTTGSLHQHAREVHMVTRLKQLPQSLGDEGALRSQRSTMQRAGCAYICNCSASCV